MQKPFRSAASALCLGLVSLPSPAQSSAGGRGIAEQYLFAAANAERAQRGLPRLHWNEALHAASGTHAQWMAADRSIAHQYSGEPELAARAHAAGARFSLVTENVGEAPTAVELHTAWMNSAHHRENLLDPQVDAVAISVIRSGGQLYAVEDFAHTVVWLNFVAQEEAVLAALTHAGNLNVLPGSEDARDTCRLEHGYAGDRRPTFVMRYTTGDLSRLPDELRRNLVSGHFRQAAVGACDATAGTPFASYAIAVLLYP